MRPNTGCIKFLLVLIVFSVLCPLHGQTARSPIDVNLIIDGSEAFTNSKDEITAWVLSRLDGLLAEGDSLTIWNAGQAAKVIYTGRIAGSGEIDAAKKSITDFSASGNSTDFSAALTEASARQSTGLCYTLLVSASPASLSPLLSGPQANLLRFSRVEEFSGWRVLVVGLNLDTKVRQAAANFYGS